MIGFTVHESGIAAGLLDGCTDRQIAEATGISYWMVRRRLAAMRRRFHVSTRFQLALVLEPLGRRRGPLA